MFSQALTTTQFYFYGRAQCTRTGWENAVKTYPKPDLLEDPSLDLNEKVYLITGANAGIGKEITQYLASKGATIYMVCRNPERAEASRHEIVDKTKNEKIHILYGDCGLENDIRRIWREFESHQTATSGASKLHGLVCNAGALLNERTLSSEGVEVTFATHLLFGTYLLGKLALPTLSDTPGSRLIAVSSGGMYNTKFPSWKAATSTDDTIKYDGQLQYAIAKRGQVLLCERWAAEYKDKVKVVSCHPGWTYTEGVEKAYGTQKQYLEPLRSLWQGAEGIAWLCVAPKEQIEDGAFYLDRTPRMKHLSGWFMSEGSFTKNTPAEVDEMMQNLAQWAHVDS